MTLLKMCKAELADYSTWPRQSESHARSGTATTAAAAIAALNKQLSDMSAELLRGRKEATVELQDSQMKLEELGIKFKAAHTAWQEQAAELT